MREISRSSRYRSLVESKVPRKRNERGRGEGESGAKVRDNDSTERKKEKKKERKKETVPNGSLNDERAKRGGGGWLNESGNK